MAEMVSSTDWKSSVADLSARVVAAWKMRVDKSSKRRSSIEEKDEEDDVVVVFLATLSLNISAKTASSSELAL